VVSGSACICRESHDAATFIDVRPPRRRRARAVLIIDF
jgi:hypothetical protein